jgi:hypothetical protein
MALPKIHNLTVRVLIAAIVVGALVLGTGLRAQFSRPTFEVDSVKLNTYGGAAGNFAVSPGGLTITNYSLLRLISNAYGMHEFVLPAKS